MFVGRKDEINRLEEIYRADTSSIVVLYGREKIGKTALALHFAAGKKFMYYEAVDGLEDLQAEMLCKAFDSEKGSVSEVVREKLESLGEGKKIVVFDEFHLMAQHGSLLSQVLVDLLQTAKEGLAGGPVMIVLISSSVRWVENDMVESMGAVARLISGFIKLGELSFQSIVRMLPKTPVSDCVLVKAVLGGVPGLIGQWRETLSSRDNIIRLLLSDGAILAHEAEHLLKTELRELPCYNRILYAMATGRTKMNDIYNMTGFSRAKISVYIKNLIHMGIAEKVFSYDDSGHENLKKGLYRIKDPFIAFYYAFVFPNRSLLALQKAGKVYDEIVAPKLDGLLRPYFADVCREFLQLMSDYGKLGARFTDYRSWHGKQGTIDIIATGEGGASIAALCVYRAGDAVEEDFEELKELSKQAGINPGQFYLFAKTGFDAGLKKIAESSGNSLKLVSLGDL